MLSVVNYRGEVSGNNCCGGVARDTPNSVCTSQCLTYFNICLKEYQSHVSEVGSCSYGNASSPVLGSTSFRNTNPDADSTTILLPFSFRWTVSR